MSGRTRTLGLVSWCVASASVALMILGVLGVDAQRRQADADAMASSVAGKIAATVADGTSEAERALEFLAASVSAPNDHAAVAPAVTGFSTVGIIDGDVTTVHAGQLPPDLVSSPEFRAVAAKALDTGTGQVSQPLGDARAFLVLPLYAVGESLRQVPPTPTTESRRSAIAAFVVGALDVDGILDGLDTSGATVTVSDRGVELASTGSSSETGSSRTRSIEIEVGDRTWVVTSTARMAKTGVATLFVALAIVTVALAAAFVVRLQIRRRADLEDQVARERQRQGVITDLAPLLQHSLQLSDVLPALAVQLVDRFDLDGLAVVAPVDGGAVQEVFCHGSRPSMRDTVEVGLVRPLAAGTAARLTLSRGGRIIAELRFCSVRDLDESDIEGIHASAELVTSALVTAQAIDRQRVAMDQLSELDALKNVFLTTATHELKTPLAAMLGLADVLDAHWEQLGDGERRTMVARVAANAHALDNLVAVLLDFSRLETGDLTVDAEPVHLETVVEQVLDRQRSAWGEHSIEIDVDEGPVVHGDRVALERILTNLVANAVKYSPPGTTVHVSVRHRAGHAELVVDDEGPGIEVDERQRVFERFYRGRSDAVVRTRGVGVGLSVVREFVRRMDGTVEVDESPTGGARFRCRFPHSALVSTGRQT